MTQVSQLGVYCRLDCVNFFLSVIFDLCSCCNQDRIFYAIKCYMFYSKRVNDCVLKVNNIDLTNVEYRTAVQAISRGEVVNMVSKRFLQK